MVLSEIVRDLQILPEEWVIWKEGTFCTSSHCPKERRANRETLARIYQALVTHVGSSKRARALWIEHGEKTASDALPSIISFDGFLRMYALGAPCSVGCVRRLWSGEGKIHIDYPLEVEWNESGREFFDVDATPPGILAKIFPSIRIKKDRVLLKRIAHDLKEVSTFAEGARRKFLTLAILSHGAAYRELDGKELLLPSFLDRYRMTPYTCKQHLVAEGIKTISLTPKDPLAPPIYLCQGTEFWPSQPSMLGSILANLGEHGSATGAYAHSWRRIHQHLRAFGRAPIVAGHSMGGALAIQIGLYSHRLIECAYAFNPPMPNDRDDQFYRELPEVTKEKIQVCANLDDFVFWRIGAKLVGRVRLFLAKRRWKYYPVGLWDCLLFFPALIKFILNVRRAFPAHQRIAALSENWVSVRLNGEEIAFENQERLLRFDYLHFLPKLYDPMKLLVTYGRKIFGWGLEREYLRNEIELLTLHERDLLDTLTEENRSEIEQELQVIRKQIDYLKQQR